MLYIFIKPTSVINTTSLNICFWQECGVSNVHSDKGLLLIISIPLLSAIQMNMKPLRWSSLSSTWQSSTTPTHSPGSLRCAVKFCNLCSLRRQDIVYDKNTSIYWLRVSSQLFFELMLFCVYPSWQNCYVSFAMLHGGCHYFKVSMQKPYEAVGYALWWPFKFTLSLTLHATGPDSSEEPCLLSLPLWLTSVS